MKRSKKRSPAAEHAAGRAAPVAGEPYYTAQARADLAWWRRHNPKLLGRIEALVADIRRSPFAEHRLVYRIEAGTLYIAQARYHY